MFFRYILQFAEKREMGDVPPSQGNDWEKKQGDEGGKSYTYREELEKIKQDVEQAKQQFDRVNLSFEEMRRVSPEKQKEYEPLLLEHQRIVEEMKNLEAEYEVLSKRTHILETKAEKQITLEEMTDPQAQEIFDKIYDMKQRIREVADRIATLHRYLELLPENTLSSEEIETMKRISPSEFLSYPFSERLRFVTRGNVSFEAVKEGKVDHLEFTFTFWDSFNEKLYHNVTAGTVLPENVRTVESWWKEYYRRWLKGEFFASDGERLLIHEGTKVAIKELASQEEMEKLEKAILQEMEEYKDDPWYELLLKARERWIDGKFLKMLASERFWQFQGTEKEKRGKIEYFLVEVEQVQDDFFEDYPWEKTFVDGKVTEKFAGYVMHALLVSNFWEVAKAYGFNETVLRQARREQNPALGGGPIDLSRVSIEGVTEEEKQRIRQQKKFVPGSRDAVILFTMAAQAAWLPEEWAKQESLHILLRKESNGRVGVLNYTIKGHTLESFKQAAINAPRTKNPLGVHSTATWLGQLILTNVDLYYPDGRHGIGDALNEAVGMLRYIKARHKNPEQALAFHRAKNRY